MIPTKQWTRSVLSAAAFAGLLIVPAAAQQSASPPASTAPTPPANTAPTAAPGASTEDPSQSPVARLIPRGTIMGPGTLRPEAMSVMCDPRSAGFTGWRIERLEQALSLTEEQKQKLEDMKAASVKAVETIVKACPAEAPITASGRLELMERRLTALLDATKTLRAAFDPFYASLTDEQKARMTADERGRRWRWERSAERHYRR